MSRLVSIAHGVDSLLFSAAVASLLALRMWMPGGCYRNFRQAESSLCILEIEHAYNSLKKEKHFLEALLLRQVSYFPLSCLTALYLSIIEHGTNFLGKKMSRLVSIAHGVNSLFFYKNFRQAESSLYILN